MGVMDWGTIATGFLIAVLAGIGLFSIIYFADRLALKDHEEEKARKRGKT